MLARDGHGSLMDAALDSEWAGCRPVRGWVSSHRVRAIRGIDPHLLPPCCFVAAAMDFSMVPTTERHRELVAHFAAECPALRKSQVMGIGGLAAANQTRLFGHMSDMLAVSNPARLRQGQRALIDRLRSRPVLRLRRKESSAQSRAALGPLPSEAYLCQASQSSPVSPGSSPPHAAHRAAVSLFFSASDRCAQSAASSPPASSLISPSSRSRSAADASGPSVGSRGID